MIQRIDDILVDTSTGEIVASFHPIEDFWNRIDTIPDTATPIYQQQSEKKKKAKIDRLPKMEEEAIRFLETVDLDSAVSTLVSEIKGESVSSYIYNALTSEGSVPSSQGKGGGPKPKKLINPFKNWFMECESFDMLPSWCKDCIYGSSRAHTDNTDVPYYFIYTLLSVYDEISTPLVKEFINRKRRAMGDKEVGDRYVRSVVASCRNAINAIQFQLDKHKDDGAFVSYYYNAVTSDAEEWLIEKAKHQPITTEQLTANLFAAGLTVEEVNNYLIKSGRL